MIEQLVFGGTGTKPILAGFTFQIMWIWTVFLKLTDNEIYCILSYNIYVTGVRDEGLGQPWIETRLEPTFRMQHTAWPSFPRYS